MDKQRRTIKTIISGLLALALCVSSVTCLSAPVYAGSVTNPTTATKTTASVSKATKPAVVVPTASSFTVGSFDLIFNGKMRTDKTLNSSYRPTGLTAKGKPDSIKIAWSHPKLRSSINGYFILRKDTDSNNWRQIAKVSKYTKSYKDETATASNCLYRYTVVAYKKTDGVRMISFPVKWAGAVTSDSTKENVTKFGFLNPAKDSTVKIGSTNKLSLTFPYKKPASKAIRWTSSDTSIAKVNNKGIVTGVSHGTVTLTGRTHTGNVITTQVTVIKPGTAQAIVDVMASWIDYSESNGKHKGIIDIYNSVTPWPRGYKVKYSDEWCATCVSAAAIQSGTAKYTGRECGVPQFITYFKNRGRWEEDGSIKPRKGDLIIYGWSIGSGVTVFGNNWSASHIGVVESVKGNTITVLEGNMGFGIVGRRTLTKGWRFIRGYCRPAYKK